MSEGFGVYRVQSRVQGARFPHRGCDGVRPRKSSFVQMRLGLEQELERQETLVVLHPIGTSLSLTQISNFWISRTFVPFAAIRVEQPLSSL